VLEATVGGGIPARLYRVSYSGELAYEIGVSAGYGDALIRALIAAGAPHGIAAYGTEALGVMRIEKGHAAGPARSATRCFSIQKERASMANAPNDARPGHTNEVPSFELAAVHGMATGFAVLH
jgi:hypothetical protein